MVTKDVCYISLVQNISALHT